MLSTTLIYLYQNTHINPYRTRTQTSSGLTKAKVRDSICYRWRRSGNDAIVLNRIPCRETRGAANLSRIPAEPRSD